MLANEDSHQVLQQQASHDAKLDYLTFVVTCTPTDGQIP
ncbi:unnamed protein product [Schistocephalus solidus]|uniref:Pyridoxamine 5'-phosphate oxidase n=1 Tax=Schistocephalus solidus TaxID=70667 RepID=A0A183TU97_SCHSO|nr:unnamed protein product [Schistocephalus solidus]